MKGRQTKLALIADDGAIFSRRVKLKQAVYTANVQGKQQHAATAAIQDAIGPTLDPSLTHVSRCHRGCDSSLSTSILFTSRVT